MVTCVYTNWLTCASASALMHAWYWRGLHLIHAGLLSVSMSHAVCLPRSERPAVTLSATCGVYVTPPFFLRCLTRVINPCWCVSASCHTRAAGANTVSEILKHCRIVLPVSAACIRTVSFNVTCHQRLAVTFLVLGDCPVIPGLGGCFVGSDLDRKGSFIRCLTCFLAPTPGLLLLQPQKSHFGHL